jgi:hypothetical protein
MAWIRNSSRPQTHPWARRIRPTLEVLEERLVPYSASGNAWPHPALITLSFVPDGTIIGSNSNGYVYSNLFSTFTGHPGWSTATWQNQILKAAQVWAQQTNVNFSVVADDGATFGSGSYQQGDPKMGDIRIGGYNFGNSNYLAVADMPPQTNNYSIAGDIVFNTGQPFNIGATYDLFSVAAHEFGHSLGLNEGNLATSVMYSVYNSAKTGLNSDDVAGIRSIYSNSNLRSPDAFNTGASNGSFATATNVSNLIDPTTQTALVNNLDITSTSQAEYFSFTAPAGTGASLTVSAVSSGLSLLSPSLTVYAADQSTVLGRVSGAGRYGTTLSVTVSGINAGKQYYVKVAGADTTAFSTGAYALSLNFGSGPSPTPVPPNTQTADGSTFSSGGGEAQTAPNHNPLGVVFNLLSKVTYGLLGNLLGLSTTFGLGAGIGDACSVSGDDGEEMESTPSPTTAPIPHASVAPPGNQLTARPDSVSVLPLPGVVPDRQQVILPPSGAPDRAPTSGVILTLALPAAGSLGVPTPSPLPAMQPPLADDIAESFKWVDPSRSAATPPDFSKPDSPSEAGGEGEGQWDEWTRATETLFAEAETAGPADQALAFADKGGTEAGEPLSPLGTAAALAAAVGWWGLRWDEEEKSLRAAVGATNCEAVT